jgi:hypothetical protein
VKSVIRFVLAAAIAYGLYRYAVRSGCGTGNAIACPEPALEEGVGVTLNAAEVCPSAGYLCVGRNRFQVARWPLDKGRLRIRVPLPDFLDDDTARQARDAAIEGIMAWDGHPFPIVIDAGAFTLHTWDIRVVWTEGLNNGAEGQMRVGWKVEGKRIAFDTDGLAVVVPPIAGLLAKAGVVPAQDMQEILLSRIKAAAMHEMGHGLGLLHSDLASDIMFPQMSNDAALYRVSARDLATVDALYALPNGASVQ